MARAVYDVVYHQGQWKILQGGKHHGPYANKDAAIAAARNAAQATHMAGTPSQVRVHNMNGQYETEWTYGNDPFPPRG